MAAEALAARARVEYVAPNRIAQLYVMAGDEQEAIAWLERALEARHANMPYIGVAPIYEVLHSHPRFQALARRVNDPILTGPPEG